MDWIVYAIWFGCGYMCKNTRDFLYEREMKMIFARMSDQEKEALATRFINDKLNGED